MVLRNRSVHLLGCLLAGAALLGAGVPALANDLNAAQKAVRMQQYKEALGLFARAAESGNPEAQYQLGNMYLQGRGTKKNLEQARHWFSQAADQAHPGAQYGLAQLLLSEDPERARSLLAAAADQGYRSAKIQLERLSPVATANQDAPFEAQWFGAARNNDVPLLKALLAEHGAIHATDKAERTALFYAVQGNSKDAVDWLISQGSDVNHRDQAGLTPLQTAVERKHTDLMQTLLKAGADKNQVLSNGDNLLHYALRRKHYQQAKLLIERGVKINHVNKDGWTPLDLAEHQGADATAALIAKRGGKNGGGWRGERTPQNLDSIVKQLDEGRLPPLARAIINGNEALVRRLLSEDADIANRPLEDGTTPLILAIKHNKKDTIAALLQHHARVNQVAYRGVTAIQVAAQRGDPEVVQMLLDAGAIPVRADDQGRDALMSAIELGQEQAASLLLADILGDTGNHAQVQLRLRNQYAPVDRYILLATQLHNEQLLDRLLPYATESTAVDPQGRTALWFAANESNSKLIPKLLKAGLPADKADEHGRTPFMMAVSSSCLECAKQLLPVSNINHQSTSGNTPLMVAATNGDAKMASWLIQNKAEVEARNQRGDTALMLAVMGDSPEVVKPLLKANASVTRKNKLGFSSIDLAAEVGPQMHELVKSKSVLGIF